LKYAISVIVGCFVWFPLNYILKDTISIGQAIAIIIAILAMIISFKTLKIKLTTKEAIVNAILYMKFTCEEVFSLVNDKDAEFYAIAEQEIKDNVINNGLWSQALVKAKGDEKYRKVEYIKLRVKQLKK
jgi:hypothetical protein